MRTKQLKPTEVDLVTGLRRIDEEEKLFLEAEANKGPRTRLQKIWDAL
jgi:yeast amino acid transporter